MKRRKFIGLLAAAPFIGAWLDARQAGREQVVKLTEHPCNHCLVRNQSKTVVNIKTKDGMAFLMLKPNECAWIPMVDPPLWCKSPEDGTLEITYI